MQKPVNIPQDEYLFESSPEVLEKMQNAESLHDLIPEESVKDLSAVDVTNHPYRGWKRFFDIALSAAALLVLAIPMALLAGIIYLDDPGAVVFSQYRVGLHGKRFKLYKFRTMKKETPKYLATMELHDPEQYITRTGTFLRKSSLDELPQLFNVLKGDMSLVGPRPLISDEYEIHAMRMRFGVYNVRPGVTGLAQINGRDLVPPAEKVHWDVRYLQDFGLKEDLGIILHTLSQIVGGNDVVEGSNPTTQE